MTIILSDFQQCLLHKFVHASIDEFDEYYIYMYYSNRVQKVNFLCHVAYQIPKDYKALHLGGCMLEACVRAHFMTQNTFSALDGMAKFSSLAFLPRLSCTMRYKRFDF